ncbi:MAG: hypothetical protein FWB88_09695 [Defluviitaleaceae bacterium]|nr:hypothetical protein [Defluviitaleaceae bacterium]MCL2239731.1 hypothetical protein [Defluviitaleaceae bacterium]
MTKKLTSALLIVAMIAAMIPFSVSASAQIPAFTRFATTETSVYAGDEIIFTLSTVEAVNHIFAEIDGERVNAVVQTHPAPAAGTRNWTLTFTPEESQTVTVHANIANAVRGAATFAIPVTVEGALPGVININSVRRSVSGAIFAGDALTFTIVTSNAVEYVFTEVAGRWVRAVLGQTASNGDKTWELIVRPAETQTLTIYANNEFVRGAVRNNQYVEIQQIPFFTDVLRPFERTYLYRHGRFEFASSVNMGGSTYRNAMRFRFASSSFDMHTDQWGRFNLNRNYSIINGTFGRIDGTGRVNGTLIFIGDGEEIARFTVRADDMPMEISVNVIGVTQLRIEVRIPNSTNTSFAFANVTIR